VPIFAREAASREGKAIFILLAYELFHPM
jgi:hypothetical protein